MVEPDASADYDCRPWETGLLFHNPNLLNNFRMNLHSYELGHRKLTLRAIPDRPHPQPRPAATHLRLPRIPNPIAINQSTELPPKPPSRKTKANLAKEANKENKPVEWCTDRMRAKEDYRTKVFEINFEEQIKYKRVKKRELHQIVFGTQSRGRRLKDFQS